jgi:tRNA(Ile)-lysidine synthase
LAVPVEPLGQVMDVTAPMQLCLKQIPDRIGVAVSGGSDSTALLLLLAAWAKKNGVVLMVASVDHGLRVEAANEAMMVAKLCGKLGVDHTVLRWSGWDRKGNLQDQARQARRNLLKNWANTHRIDVVALGHTMDDQAETVLMRLVRGSGVDGLAGMMRARNIDGIAWIRPLLEEKRADLQAWLQGQGVAWADDPSNEDERFNRIRARKLMTELGLNVDGLAQTAQRLQTAREVLEGQTMAAARQIANVTRAGDIELDRAAFFALPDEIRHRLAAHCVKWLTSSVYRPRFTRLQNWLTQLEAGEKRTLAGCVAEPIKPDGLRLSREYAAVRELTCESRAIWDGRWVLKPDTPTPVGTEDCTVAALGPDGLKQCPDWRQTGMPRNSLLASPAIFKSGVLIAAPLAGWPQGWQCALTKGGEDYFSSALSH